MNLTDLREVFDERTRDQPDGVPPTVRLDGVRAKVRSSRRRAAGLATGALAALAVLAGLSAAVLVPTPTQRPDPVRGGSPVEGFPEYLLGTRVVAGLALTLPERSAELRYTPATADVSAFLRCWELVGVTVAVEVTIDGHTEQLQCGGGTVQETFAVTAGQPTLFHLRVTGAVRTSPQGSIVDAPVPRAGQVRLAVGEPVAWEDYPLPTPPPGPLPPLGGIGDCPSWCLLNIRSDPADPTRAVTRVVAWQDVPTIATLTNTPGYLHVRINGVEVVTASFWDYITSSATYGGMDTKLRSEFGLDLKPGDPVVVEVIPEHLTGPWEVALLLNE